MPSDIKMISDMNRIIALIAAGFLFGACSSAFDYDRGNYDDSYYETNSEVLTIRNFSSDATVWFIPDRDHAEVLPDELSEWQKISVFEVEPHSSYPILFDSNDFYVTPIETYGPEDTLIVYVFKKDVWNGYSWKELVEGRLWSCKAGYSVQDAVSSSGIITYPMP